MPYRKPSTTKLSEQQVLEILMLLETNPEVTQKSIAEQYGVSEKAISRIKLGETWRSLKGQIHVTELTVEPIVSDVIDTTPTDKVITLIEKTVAIKKHFGFDLDLPLSWGWFDGWDGLHSITTDSQIAWESTTLVDFAKELYESGINGPPIWADKAEELSTFYLRDIMSLPVGNKFYVDADNGSVIRLVDKDNFKVYLRTKHVMLAYKQKMDIRVAEGEKRWVYFTKSKNRSNSEKNSVVIAAVTTLTEE